MSESESYHTVFIKREFLGQILNFSVLPAYLKETCPPEYHAFSVFTHNANSVEIRKDSLCLKRDLHYRWGWQILIVLFKGVLVLLSASKEV